MPVYHLYFSPCSSTYDTTYAFCRAISQNAAIEVNLTDRETEVPEIPAGSVAVVAAPVYAGRIPTPMADKLARARLEGVKVVTFAVYGGVPTKMRFWSSTICAKKRAPRFWQARQRLPHTFLYQISNAAAPMRTISPKSKTSAAASAKNMPRAKPRP